MIDALIACGAGVVAFDAFEHGMTGRGRHGWRQSSLVEISDLVTAINREWGPFDAVVAHSAGAAAVARTMRCGMGVTKAVFVAPLVEPLEQAHVFSKALGLTPAVAARWPELVLERFQTSRADIDMLRVPERLPNTLIFQDQDDRFSLPEGARRLHAAWQGSTLVETHGLGHHRIIKAPAVLRDIVDFVIGQP